MDEAIRWLTLRGDATPQEGIDVRVGLYNSAVVVLYSLDKPIANSDLTRLLTAFPQNLRAYAPNADVVVVGGRGPKWLDAAALHLYLHSFPAAAIYDPKVGGGVIIATHSPDYKLGDVVEIPPV